MPIRSHSIERTRDAFASRYAIGIFAAAMLLSLTNAASAGPPASCARKFIGWWQVHIGATGQTYAAEIRADGTAQSHCPLCGQQNWTCEGNTFIIRTPHEVRQTLVSGGRSMGAGGITATRIMSGVNAGAPRVGGPNVSASAPSYGGPSMPNIVVPTYRSGGATVRTAAPRVYQAPPPTVRAPAVYYPRPSSTITGIRR
jgi:hypothetical protein